MTDESSIPLAYGTAGFTANCEQFTGIPTRSKVGGSFTRAAEMKGKLTSLSHPDEVVGAAQLFLGVLLCSEDPAEMKKVLNLLMAQKPDVVAYTSDNIENLIDAGEVAAHFWWDGNSMKTRANDGAKIEYAMPKEGLVGWLDSMLVPVGAANVDNAKAFIDFMSAKENAIIQYNFYGHASPVALDLAVAKYTPENAPELFPTVPVVFSQACSPAAQDLVTKVWTDLLQ